MPLLLEKALHIKGRCTIVRPIITYIKTVLYWFIELLKLKYMLCIVYLMIFTGYIKHDTIT